MGGWVGRREPGVVRAWVGGGTCGGPWRGGFPWTWGCVPGGPDTGAHFGGVEEGLAVENRLGAGWGGASEVLNWKI